nr:immunoglobulin heavy chain junction region [Mus musculus]
CARGELRHRYAMDYW